MDEALRDGGLVERGDAVFGGMHGLESPGGDAQDGGAHGLFWLHGDKGAVVVVGDFTHEVGELNAGGSEFEGAEDQVGKSDGIDGGGAIPFLIAWVDDFEAVEDAFGDSGELIAEDVDPELVLGVFGFAEGADGADDSGDGVGDAEGRIDAEVASDHLPGLDGVIDPASVALADDVIAAGIEDLDAIDAWIDAEGFLDGADDKLMDLAGPGVAHASGGIDHKDKVITGDGHPDGVGAFALEDVEFLLACGDLALGLLDFDEELLAPGLGLSEFAGEIGDGLGEGVSLFAGALEEDLLSGFLFLEVLGLLLIGGEELKAFFEDLVEGFIDADDLAGLGPHGEDKEQDDGTEPTADAVQEGQSELIGG